ncbi:MFS transporter [Pseudogemmobacter bohemicus]|uniref:MFS transporter n=1 Tax=Pseudogemmobacter bohemicus TaxID=2250708 RepID=UPI000DD3CC58|nr:MFS transporter [Pseudogemmobacter bohemicus]
MTASPIPRMVWMLGFVSLLMDVSSEMVNTLLPVFLASGLGASALVIGFIEGLAVAVATVTKALSGILADWSERAKPLAVLGYGLGALSRLIFPLAMSVDQVVLAKGLDRVGKGIRGAPRDAMIAAVTPPEIRAAAFGLRKSLDTMGGFLGPLIAIAAMLVFAGDIRLVFWLAAVPAALAVLLLIGRVHEPEGQTEAPRGTFRLREALRLTAPVRAVIALAGLIMLARFSEAFLLLKALEAGFSPVWVPLIIVVLHLLYGAAAWPVGILSDRLKARGSDPVRVPLLIGLGLLVAAHLVLGFAQTAPVFLVGVALWGLHMGFSQGLLGAMLAAVAPPALRGSAFGSFSLVSGLVMLTGNMAAGWAWVSWGSPAPFVIGAGLSVLAMALVALKRQKP